MKNYLQNYSQRSYLMCMEAKNKYSQILYCPTSLLIVMLSAREINFIPFTASGVKIHAKLAVFTLFWAISLSCPSDVACACHAILVNKDFQPLGRTVQCNK